MQETIAAPSRADRETVGIMRSASAFYIKHFNIARDVESWEQAAFMRRPLGPAILKIEDAQEEKTSEQQENHHAQTH